MVLLPFYATIITFRAETKLFYGTIHTPRDLVKLKASPQNVGAYTHLKPGPPPPVLLQGALPASLNVDWSKALIEARMSSECKKQQGGKSLDN